MYIWLGIDVDEQLRSVKNKSVQIEKEVRLSNSCFTLPLHISLKMSFLIKGEDYDGVLKIIEDYYRKIKSFYIYISGIEGYENIVWIKMLENKELNKIHDELNEMLKAKYDIGLHEYDLDYLFHTTLFMDNDSRRINTCYKEIKDIELPSRLTANKFLIGMSKTGELGTFSVIKEVLLK